MALIVTLDPRELSQAGWGLVMPASEDSDARGAAIREALTPLLALRCAQAGALFRGFFGAQGYRPGETKSKFLARNGAGPGPVRPELVPYYLLIVGDPGEIPYTFEEQMGVQHAVGRICFDTPEEYAHYAGTVAAIERAGAWTSGSAVFFAPRHHEDLLSTHTSKRFTQPLARSVAAQCPEWQTSVVSGPEATRARLGDLLHRGRSEFVFAAGHGMVFAGDDPRRAAHQGALLCQDWPGPREWTDPIPPEFYFSADDVGPYAGSLPPRGRILLLAASYSLGTPVPEPQRSSSGGAAPASTGAFAARLPQRLLGQPGGYTLAVIGAHDRRLGDAMALDPTASQRNIDLYRAVIHRILAGAPIGHAREPFTERHAEAASELAVMLEEVEFGRTADPQELVPMWMESQDMRALSIFGDPAVRLGVSPGSTGSTPG